MSDSLVNDNQQVDVERIKRWIKEGGELVGQLDELLNLVEGSNLLQDAQKAREDQIVDQMLHDAGIVQKPKQE